MSTNATTWFYATPETGRPYMITERLTHTFWANRLSDIYLQCVHAEPPYRAVGTWRDTEVEMEWEVKQYFILRTTSEQKALMTVCSEVLGFRPTLSYVDSNGHHTTEWIWDEDKKKSQGKSRLQEVQGNPAYQNVQKYR